MKVILIEDIAKVGSMGDIVNVKEGFARNFLLPKKLAKPATDSNMKIVEDIKRKKVLALERQKKEMVELKDKLALASCTIAVESGDDDKLFGSVNAQDIAQSLEQEGYSIDKKKIELAEPIKKLGVYHVCIKLHPEVTADVKVWVVRK
ncbi:MAG: 50S ribosomal protein L9 [Candidatus Omnitrophota bacterium]